MCEFDTGYPWLDGIKAVDLEPDPRSCVLVVAGQSEVTVGGQPLGSVMLYKLG